MPVGYNAAKEKRIMPENVAIAGGISGALTRALLQPLDVLKIRFQLQLEPLKKNSLSSKYNGIQQAVGSIFREEGARALWKGHIPAQGLSIVYGIMQFGVFEGLTAWFYPHLPQQLTTGTLQPAFHFLCGGVAGCTASLAAQPLDVIRTRFVSQGEPKLYRSFSHGVKMMYKEAGILTFYKGLSPTLVMLFPYIGFSFSFYNVSLSLWKRTFVGTPHEKGAKKSLVCGAVSGLLSKTVIYPLDLTKKRLQVQGFEEARKSFGKVQYYNGFINCLRITIREEGFFGLYKGLVPSAIKALFASGFIFMFYEISLDWLQKHKQR